MAAMLSTPRTDPSGDRPGAPPGDVKRLLVIRAGALGDCLLLLPALTALRVAFPRARLDVMGYPRRWAWALGRGLVDAVHPIEQPGMHLLFCKDRPPPAQLAALLGAYDVVLSYRPDPEGLFASNLRALGARLVLSQSPFPPPPPPAIHVADFALQLVAQLGVAPPPTVPRLQLSAEELAAVHPFFAEHRLDPRRDQLVVLHPGSGGAAKRWPLAKFAAVIAALAEQAGVRPVVVTGYAEETAAAELRARFPQATPPLAENWPLLPTAALLAQAAVFIGNDSGLTHLAAALGRPTVAVFGATDPQIWGPRGECVTIIRVGTAETSGSDRSVGALPRHRWTPDVTAVLEAVRQWLAKTQPRRSRGDRAGRS
jgi:ADP-heptose:LPS heptosyltransferase